MVALGCTLMNMSDLGDTWVYLVALLSFGCTRVHLRVCRCTWMYFGVLWCTWVMLGDKDKRERYGGSIRIEKSACHSLAFQNY